MDALNNKNTPQKQVGKKRLLIFLNSYLLQRERQTPRQTPVNLLVFDEVLKNVIPPRPLYRAHYAHHRDPVKRYGYQFQVSSPPRPFTALGFLVSWLLSIANRWLLTVAG